MKKLLIALVGVLFTFSVSHAAGNPVTLKLSTTTPPMDTQVTNFLKPWAEVVKKESQGALNIEIYPGGVLGRNIRQYLEQLDSGVFEIASVNPAYFGDRFAWASLFNIPFTSENYYEAAVSAQRLFDKGLFPGFEDYEVLVIHGTSPFYFWSTDPLRVPEDLKGRKARTGAKFQSLLMSELGMTPIPLEVNQTTENLSRGIIQATIASPHIANTFKINEIAKNILELSMGNFGIMIVMSKKAYQSLPPQGKTAIDKCRGEWMAKFAAKAMGDSDPALVEKFKKDPALKVFQPKGEDLKRWETAIRPAIAKWEKESPANENLLKNLKQELDNIRAGK